MTERRLWQASPRAWRDLLHEGRTNPEHPMITMFAGTDHGGECTALASVNLVKSALDGIERTLLIHPHEPSDFDRSHLPEWPLFQANIAFRRFVDLWIEINKCGRVTPAGDATIRRKCSVELGEDMGSE